ncbi:MAG: hypothetical protein FJ190_10485 [Gammaproteobacteria bacterium]|nr:hypothetical protein [Gammaproteobacteria bacterium]
MKKMNKTPLAATMGAALVSSMAATAVQAEANPFAMAEMQSGYMQLAEMKCGASMGMPEMKKGAEGACAGAKAKEGSCGAACQEGMKNCEAAKKTEGACGANMKGCGEGMAGCTEMKKSKDGSCGASKKPAAAPAPAGK